MNPPEWHAWKREQAIREKYPYRCFGCGGGWFSPGGRVMHAPDCPKLAREEEQRRQEKEANALRHLRTPFPITEEEKP